MSKYYNPQRTRNIYDPANNNPYKLSRSKLDLFLNCPRCFYIDRRLGIGQPPGYPFSLNSAVDALLKKEFDYYRLRQEKHPYLIENKIDAVPFKHEKLEEWRDSLRKGIMHLVPQTNIILTGGVDDVWQNVNSLELIIVDYKATSKNEAVTLDAAWQIGYKRQTEIYQWLFRQNGFTVSDTAYFVYCNGRTDLEHFNKRLEFDVSVIPYKGKTNWVEGAVQKAYACLQSNEVPAVSEECDFCQYTRAINNVIQDTE